jgi:hypothetical protein
VYPLLYILLINNKNPEQSRVAQLVINIKIESGFELYLDVSVDASGDDDVLFRAESHAFDRVIVSFEEMNLNKVESYSN